MHSSSHHWKELSDQLHATSTFIPQNKIGGGVPQNMDTVCKTKIISATSRP
jgi:hypothetical protein